MRNRLVLWAVLSFSLLQFTVSSQEVLQVAQESPGVKNTHIYEQFTNGELVDVFSGGLTVIHPVGPGLPGPAGSALQPKKVFNSKDSFMGYDESLLYPSLNADKPYGPLGYGWRLGYGQVKMRLGYYVTPDRVNCVPFDAAQTYLTPHFTQSFFYVDESGAEHQLYSGAGLQPFVPSDPAPHTHFYVTNDGSYLRAKYYNGIWTIYYPDGSTRQAGDTAKNAYVAPQFHQGGPPTWPCPAEAWEVTNPWSHGWWVTQITDRAGNTSEISYLPYSGQNLPGSINQIKDPYNRIISFNYSNYAPTGDNLLESVAYPNGSRETYTYTTSPGRVWGGWKTWPVLASATDAAGMQVRYEYVVENNQNPERNFVRPQMAAIYYPTGAVSRYTYVWYTYARQRMWGFAKFLDQHEGQRAEGFTIGVIKRTIETAPIPGGTPNKLSWTWERKCRPQPFLGSLGYTPMVYPVITRDPLGTQEVYYFAAGDHGDELFPPGKELLKTRRFPGAAQLTKEYLDSLQTANDFNVWDKVVSWRRQWWEFSGGDTWRCQDIGKLVSGTAGGETNRYGNPRVYISEEGERNALETVLWKKRSESAGWDGFGHYSLTFQTDGTPYLTSTASRFTGMRYQAPDEIPPVAQNWSAAPLIYQTDHLLASFGGMVNGAITTETTIMPNGNEVVSSLSIPGKFRMSQMEYYVGAGLLKKRRGMVGTASNLFYKFSTNLVGVPAGGNPESGADKVLNLLYDGSGNISKLIYSRADATGATYGFNFEWQSGMVSRMYRDNTPYGDEFNRTIQASTSLILSNTDPNGLQTSFQYDALNRLTKITPPNGEYATYIAYPNDSTTAGGNTWTTAHDILVYRGPAGFTPDVSDNIAGLDAGAAYQHYIFDDMGRLVKTRSVHPEGYLTETMTSYDPLGKAFFSSLPYRYQGATQPEAVELNWSTKLAEAGDVFVSTILRNPNQTPQTNAYGSISSFYEDAVLSGDFQQLLGLYPEPLDRPIWAFKPDASKTKTTYDGLNSAVTLFGIKTGETIDFNAESTTWYYKDLWGRLAHVEPPVRTPPVGTPAVYTYNELDQLLEVNLSGQLRSFSYDALGRILTAENPENGKTTYLGYDCIGNLLGAQDANGTAQGYRLQNEYDLLGRPTATKKVRASDGQVLMTLLENVYDTLPGYDLGPSLGKLVQSKSRQDLFENPGVESVERLAYQALTGRVETVTQSSTAGGGLEENSVTLTYDLYGQVTDQFLPDGTALTNLYSHGAVAQRQVNGNPVLAALNYDVTGTLKKVLFDTGESQQTKLDEFARPAGFAFLDAQQAALWGNGSFVDASAPYAYDGAGNIASVGVSATQKDSFSYDDLSRLKAADVHRKGGFHQYTYTYDAYGNLTARNMVVPAAFQALNLNQYLTQTLQLDPNEASEYIQATVFNATVQGTSNRLGTVTRGANAGLAQVPPQVNMTYDANGNLTGDGKFTYAYDALNRQVSVTEVATGNLLAEYAYLPSGERVAALKYSGNYLSDYTRYFRDGAAVVWEQSDSVGHAKSYVYAGGRMAYTHEAWRTCVYPRLLKTSPLTLGAPTVTASAGSSTATAEFSLPMLPEAAEAIEVRLVKGSSLVSSQRLERPEGGWCGQERVTFAGLPEGADYQAGLTVFVREGRAKRMPPNAYLVERLKLGLVRGKLAAWTVARFKEEGDNVSEEATAGFASLAPEGAEDYTAQARTGSEMQEVARGQQAEEVALPPDSTAVAVQGATGSTITLASATLGLRKGGGGGIIRPVCTDYAVRTYYGVDHLGTVRYTRSLDLSGNVVATSSHDYEPFGVEIPGGNSGCGNTHRFTGQERDLETGNDYFHFRYYGGSIGRFATPDEILGKTDDPQSWNLYSYVQGNPVNTTDPTGHIEEYSFAKQQVATDAKKNADFNKGTEQGTAVGLVITAIVAAVVAPALVEPLLQAASDVAQGDPAGAVTDLANAAAGAAGAQPESEGQPQGSGASPQESPSGKLAPNPNAEGPHTSFKTDEAGKTTHYETYQPSDPRNPQPYTAEKRFDGAGSSHYDKPTKTDVPTPHVHEPSKSGGPLDRARPARPQELPKGYGK